MESVPTPISSGEPTGNGISFYKLGPLTFQATWKKWKVCVQNLHKGKWLNLNKRADGHEIIHYIP